MNTLFLIYRFTPVFSLVLFFGLPSAWAQQYRILVEAISVEEGLSNRFVRSILQDSRGFMWFGTQIGLNRYDGYRFKTFNIKNSALQEDHIEQMWEDADSNLWLGYGLNSESNKSFDKIDVLNINTLEIKTLEEYLGDSLPLSIKDIHRIHSRTGSKQLYLTTTTGRIYLYKGQGEFEVFYDQQEAATIQDLWFGPRYTWICSSKKLLAINDKKEVVYEQALEIPFQKHGDFFAQIDGTTMLLSINDGFKIERALEWRAKENVLLERDSLALFDKEMLLDIDVQYSEQLNDNFNLLYNRTEFNLYDKEGNLLYADNYRNAGEPLRVVYVDRQDNIWLGIATKGLLKISIPKKRFDVYLKGVSTRAITHYTNPRKLIINSYNGRFLIDELTTETSYISDHVDNIIIPSKFGNHYWASLLVKLNKLDGKTLESVNVYTYEQDPFLKKTRETATPLHSMWGMYEDKSGGVWLGLDNGLGYLAKGADSLTLYDVPPPCEQLNSSMIYDFHENKYGFWIASSTGLYLRRHDHIWVKYSRQQDAPYQLAFDYLYDINEDSRGNLWLATRGGGIQCLNPKTGVCRQWTTQQGLSHDVVYASLEDDYGDIWMSSNKGLMRMDSATYLINTFLPSDGLPHEEFNRKSAYKNHNGRLYFGGLSGVVGFDPSDFSDKDETIPPLQVTRYQYFDGKESKLVDATPTLDQNGKIKLTYDDLFFVVELALLDYKVGAPKTYAYQIEGMQENWSFTKNPMIRVDGLRPGEYNLRVKAELSSGSWSPVLLEVPIQVVGPFYLQWWFILGVIAVVSVLVWGYTRMRERSLQQTKLLLEKRVRERTQTIEEQAAALRELDEAKTRFFDNISHELRTPLTLILGPVEAALNQHPTKKAEEIQPLLHLVRKQGLKLKQLIEQILNLSKLEADKLALEEQPQVLAEVLKRLWSNFEAQAELQGVEWLLNQEIPPQLRVWMDADKLEKIINNLLSNALKHTSEGEYVGMSTRWDTATNCLYLNVNDTGKGIAKEDLPHIFKRFYQSKEGKAIGGTGIGLSLASQLAQLMGGDIQVASIMGTGSTFMLTVPFRPLKEAAPVLEAVAESFILPAPASEQSATVLIVEDLLDMRLFLSDLLSQYYKVKTAENGQVAFRLLQEKNHEIDLVLSDVMMPKMNGFELLTKIKEQPQDAQVPVIMLTARTAERDKLKALRIGVDDYLQKPFSNKELLARIKNLLEHYEQRQLWIQEQKDNLEEAPQKEVIKDKSTPNGNEWREELPVEVVTDPWTEHLEEVVKREIGNTQFNLVHLAHDLNLSERQLRRKIKAKTGLTPNQYFRCIKLDLARNFLETRRYQTVAEVAHKVGFSNVHYFSKLYLAQYGKKPIEYLR